MSKLVLGSATDTILWSLYEDGTLWFSAPENAETGSMDHWESSYFPDYEDMLKEKVTSIRFDTRKKITLGKIACKMFSHFDNLSEISLENVDTSEVTDFSFMFSKCRNLKRIYGIESINTGNASDFEGMFNCTGIEEIDISSWDLSKAENMSFMFYKCNSLINFFANNSSSKMLKNMYSMFGYCSELKTVKMNNWNVAKAWEFTSMFQKCQNLISAEMNGWNSPPENKINLNEMFEGCSSIEEINIAGLYVTPGKYEDVFKGCRRLKKISVPDNFDVYSSNLNAHPDRTEACYDSKRVYKKYTGKWSLNSPYNHAQAIDGDEFLNSVIPGGTWYWEQNG